ncbi:hypothetical protein [Phaffia rhodozyma]|uniref:Uncharacterized protein n=1 Tax=Phaffia rhodozyma TaxID=264483 RepID=A0A0F7SL74_PHARH|nr:hypothetical protein [Phaffia rhodozyma]
MRASLAHRASRSYLSFARSQTSLRSNLISATTTTATTRFLVHPRAQLQSRTFLSKLLGTADDEPPIPKTTPLAPPYQPAPDPKIILEQDNLFHPLSTSPFEDLRMRAERIKMMAPCPVCLDHFGERNLVTFDSPQAGWPTHCSEEHYLADEEHGKYVDRLREANEDEHDLRSGRYLAEFENLPGFQPYDQVVNYTNWDTFFYTRTFPSMDNLRVYRHMTKVLTYPITIASTLDQFSPYLKKTGRLTQEGRRSMIALRSTLHPEQTPKPVPGLNNVVRIFILGARSESSLPTANWEQLSRMFPKAVLKVYFVGPQAALPSNWTPKPTFESENDPLYEEEMENRRKHEEELERERLKSEGADPFGFNSAPTTGQAETKAEPKKESPLSNSPAGATGSVPFSTVDPTSPAGPASAPTPSAPANPPAAPSTSSVTKPKFRSLDHLRADSPDRQQYPYTESLADQSIAPIPSQLDRNSLSSTEGSYGPTFFVPPTPALVHVNGPRTNIPGRDESANYGVPAWTIPISPEITVSSIQAPYEAIHDQFGPFDPYSDVFFAFSPGFGFPSSMSPGRLQVHKDAEWGETLPLILETKCPLFVTGFSPKDVERDVKSLEGLEDVDGQFDWLLNPGENFFASERWEVADFDPRVMVKTNWGIWGIRGKMDSLTKVEEDKWGLVQKQTRKL